MWQKVFKDSKAVNVKLLSCVLGVRAKQEENVRVFLLVCGLRRVKDPLYLLDVFAGITV